MKTFCKGQDSLLYISEINAKLLAFKTMLLAFLNAVFCFLLLKKSILLNRNQ